MPQSGYSFKLPADNADYLLVDVTERQVVRDVDNDNQRDFYSGKKSYIL